MTLTRRIRDKSIQLTRLIDSARVAIWSIIVIATLPGELFAEPLVLQDGRGKSIRISQPVARIVSLAPYITENLFAIDAGDLLVGVTQYSDFPAAANKIEQVGTYKSFDFERIVDLEPDIVIGWISGNPSAHISKLESLGLTVFLTEPQTPENVAEDLRALGQISGKISKANAVANKYLTRISALRQTYSRRPPVQVFYQVWNNPLITLNDQHIISNLIRGCGGINVFGSLNTLAPKVGLESILAKDPDTIIASGMDKSRPEWLDDWRRYDFMQAVKLGNLYHVHPDILQRHTIRLADGMSELCDRIDKARRKIDP
jgi:iron complex transport system substrate-binding protein